MALPRAVLAGLMLFVACCLVGQTGVPAQHLVVTRDPILPPASTARFRLAPEDIAQIRAEARAVVVRPARASRAAPRRVYVAVDDAYWFRVSRCESPSNARSRNGKYGGYFQMTQQAWHGGGGQGVPETHSYDEQLVVAKAWAARTNPSRQWPVCWKRAARG